MTNVKNPLNKNDQEEIDSEDLQLMLRSKLGKQVVVLKSESSSLLPPGENFACRIFKLDTVIRRDEDKSEKEELHLVAKMFPTAEVIRNVFDFRLLFKKEIFFYEKLAPVLRQLEIDFGIKNEEAFDISPKVFGVKRAADPESENIDEGVIILMENLKMNGYYMLNKVQGLDLDHSRMAIKALARLHGLSIACKHHRADFFNSEVLAHAKFVPIQEDESKPDLGSSLFDMLCKDPQIVKHSKRFSRLLTPNFVKTFFIQKLEEPWLSIAHLDFWTNNILYRKNEVGKPNDVKFIDFQNYAYCSPLRDLPYFLCTSTEQEVMMGHFDELLDLYYDTFLEVLKRMRCDLEPFGRESFERQLKTDAEIEFFHSIMAIKFFCAEFDSTYDPTQIEDVVIFSPVNKLGYEKWRNIILTYIRKGWL